MVAVALLQFSAFMAGAAVLFDRIARPRLPVYTIEQAGMPWLTRSSVTKEWKVALTTDVSLFNENFVHIDVHALSFDMYYAIIGGDDGGRQELQHIATVEDRQQHQKQLPVPPLHPTTEQTWKRPRRRLLKRSNNSTETPVVWSIEARSDFATSTTMYLSVYFGGLLRSLYQLLCRFWQNSGRLTVPMTGVAHIRAVVQSSNNSTSKKVDEATIEGSTKSVKKPRAFLKVPFTVSIICDNRVDTWRWRVQIVGVECAMHNFVPGWLDMETATTTVREFALNRLPVNETGGVLSHPTMSWEQVLETIAWEESLQHL